MVLVLGGSQFSLALDSFIGRHHGYLLHSSDRLRHYRDDLIPLPGVFAKPSQSLFSVGTFILAGMRAIFALASGTGKKYRTAIPLLPRETVGCGSRTSTWFFLWVRQFRHARG